MVWDEGNAIDRADRVERWLGLVPSGEREAAPRFSAEGIRQGWPYTTRVEGHPAFYGLLIAVGHAVAPSGFDPLTAYRLGPIGLFAIAVGAVFYRMARRFSWTAAWAGTIGLLLVPRLFAHAHFASTDGPLVACWLLAWAAFDPARNHRCRRLLFGLFLGMAMSTKATGWLVPIPFLVWALCYRDRKTMVALAWGIPVAVLTFFVLNPPLWLDPVDGMARFFDLNLHRARDGWNLSTWFLGRRYSIDYPLPWYNTLFWVGVTVPVGLLVFQLLGLVATVRHPLRRRWEMLLVANVGLLLLVRAVPGTPPHDGVRLFVGAFAFLALLGGIGVEWLVGLVRNRRGRLVVVGLIGLVYLVSAVNLTRYAPHWLSFYNGLIGGPAGAERVGMESTYYWDSLDDGVLDWLDRSTRPGGKVRFASGPSENLRRLQAWGRFRLEFATDDAGEFDWYVLQNRPGVWQPHHWHLWEHETAAYTKWLSVGGEPVPLLKIFSRDAFDRAVNATGE